MPDPGYININNDPAALGTFFSDKKPDVAQPNTFSHTQQQGAQQTQQSISYTGADPAYITRMEQFEGITHQEIYRNAQAMSPGIMHHQADTWISIADTLSGGLLGANLAIQKALTSGIEGQMADAALAAARKFYQQASDVQEVISSCGHRIKAAAHAAEVVKTSVPPPAGSESGTAAPNTLDAAQIIIAAAGAGLTNAGDGDQVAYQRGVEALYRTAIDTMNNNYKPSYGPAGDGIPTFVPVDVPGGGTGGGGGTEGGGTGGGTGGPGGAGTGNGGGTGAGQGEQAPSPTDPATTQTAGLDSNSTGAQQSSGNRTPETATNPGVNTSTSPTATTTSASSRPVSPGVGTATPGGSSGTGSGNPGRTVSGLPVGASSTATTASGSSAAASTGRSGMPGMMSPGAGKKDDTESNRKTPDYLIGDHEEELLGQHIPMVPEVIGDNAPATRPDPPQRLPSRDQRR